MDAEANARFARRGYKLPPPALAGQLAKNQEAVARVAAEAARDSELGHLVYSRGLETPPQVVQRLLTDRGQTDFSILFYR